MFGLETMQHPNMKVRQCIIVNTLMFKSETSHQHASPGNSETIPTCCCSRLSNSPNRMLLQYCCNNTSMLLLHTLKSVNSDFLSQFKKSDSDKENGDHTLFTGSLSLGGHVLFTCFLPPLTSQELQRTYILAHKSGKFFR